MPMGSFHRMLGRLGWTPEGYLFWPDQGGAWFLEFPLLLDGHARRQVGRSIYVEGYRCGFNILTVTHMLPRPAPGRLRRWFAMMR